MYSRSGTIVWPLALARPEQLVDLGAVEQQLARRASARGCSGCRLLERRDVGADEPGLAALDARVGVGQVDLAGADRLDLGAGQDDAGLERVVDREVVAGSSVEGDGRSSRMEWLLRTVGGWEYGRAWPGRTNAGPMRAGVRVAYPPTGCPTRRPSPARWCSYAYCRSLHITSFRSREPYPKRRTERKRAGASAPLRRRVRRPRARPRRAEDLERLVERRVRRRPACRSGTVDDDVRASGPTSWIQRLSGVSQRAMVSLNAPPSPVELLPLLDGALAERLWPTSVARSVSWSAPATISLAEALPPSMRHDDRDASGRSRRRRASASVATWSPVGVLLPEDRARADELAGDRRGPRSRSRPGCRAGRGSSFVRPASTCGRERVAKLGRAVVGEAGQPDVADGRRRRGPWLTTSCCWTTSRVIARSNGGAVAALDRQRHDRALRAADPVAGRVDGQPVERRAVDREDRGRRPGGRPSRPASRRSARRRPAGSRRRASRSPASRRRPASRSPRRSPRTGR